MIKGRNVKGIIQTVMTIRIQALVNGHGSEKILRRSIQDLAALQKCQVVMRGPPEVIHRTF